MKYNIDSIIKKLLIKYPDFSDIINNTKFIEDYNIETACTDGKDILYNPNFMKSLSKKQQLMVLAHEVCHIALDHINRLKDKNMELWNIATDAVINANLEKDGCELFDGCVQIKDALEYDSEELYEKLLEVYKQKEKQQKQHGQQGQDGQQSQQGQDGQQSQQGQDGQQSQQGQDGQQSQQGQDGQQSQQGQDGQQSQQGQDGQQSQQGKQGQSGNSNSKSGKQSIDDIVDSVLNQNESSRVKNHGSWSKNKNSNKENSDESFDENSDDISETKNNDSFEDENINNNDLNDSESEESKSSSSSNDKTTSDSSKSSDKKSKGSDDSKNNNSDKTTSDIDDSNEDKDKSDSNSADSKIDNEKIKNKFKDRKKEKDKSKPNNSKENNDTSKEYSDSDFQEKHFEKSDKDVFEKNRNDRLEKIQIEKEKLKQQLMEYGQGLSNTFGEGSIGEIGNYGQPIDWRRLLRESITRDVDWTLRNAEVEDGIVLSRLEEFPCSETEIVLDTSGSVSEDLLRNFLRECKNILRNSKIKVGCFDTRFYGFEEIKTMEDIENFKFRGFGGTDFNAAVNAFSKRVDNRIVFTDGYAPMPDKKVKAIWLVYGDGSIRPDGGKVIHITPDMLNKLNGRSRTLRR